jgi:hypothetical protein
MRFVAIATSVVLAALVGCAAVRPTGLGATRDSAAAVGPGSSGPGSSPAPESSGLPPGSAGSVSEDHKPPAVERGPGAPTPDSAAAVESSPAPPPTVAAASARVTATKLPAASNSAYPAATLARPTAPTPTQTAATPTSAKPQASAALDLKALEQRLRDTRAIGIFTTLSLRNQADDLLDQFRAFYRGGGKPPIATLRQWYDLPSITMSSSPTPSCCRRSPI